MRLPYGFSGFWKDFDEINNDFVRILSKHYKVVISNKPDYLFCSCFNNNHVKYRNCIKIFYTGENVIPNFNLFDYAIGFADIDFGDRYLRWPLYKLFQYRKDLELALSPDNPYKNVKKDGFCAFVVSNATAMKERKEIFDLLNSYKNVSSGGKYMNNIGGPVEDKLEFQSKHKFVIAFENSSSPGYTTEKIVQAFASKSIPIYYGNPNIADEFNEKAFINCHKYNNFAEVLAKVKEIDTNDELFYKMLDEPIANNNLIDNNPLESFLLNIVKQDVHLAKKVIHDTNYYKEVYKAKLFDKKRILFKLKKKMAYLCGNWPS